MTKASFIHMSDTHILKEYDNELMNPQIKSTGKTPTDTFKKAASYIRETYPNIDFVLITGDLVHEGDAQDYKHYKELLEESFGDTPVHVCIGNHDRIGNFREGYLGEENNNKPYYYAEEVTEDGLRLISLDSSYDNSGIGTINEEQMEWLKEVVKTQAKGGSMLIIHHPPTLSNGEVNVFDHSLTNSNELYEVIKNSDIFAILSGHTHQNRSARFGTITHQTTDSTAFGVKLDDKYMEMNDRTGIVYCTVENEELTTFSDAIVEEIKVGFKASFADMMKHMKEMEA